MQLESLAFDRVDAGSVRIERAQLLDVDLAASKLRGLSLVDVVAVRLSAANGDWGGAQLRRVVFESCRLTGLSLGEGRVGEVEFRDCKLDYANFRHSEIERVTFEGCVLAEADFQGARIAATRFSNCELRKADFTKADLDRVDLRGSRLELAGSVLGLGGAIVDPLQLMELSPLLAHELGITVEGS